MPLTEEDFRVCEHVHAKLASRLPKVLSTIEVDLPRVTERAIKENAQYLRGAFTGNEEEFTQFQTQLGERACQFFTRLLTDEWTKAYVESVVENSRDLLEIGLPDFILNNMISEIRFELRDIVRKEDSDPGPHGLMRAMERAFSFGETLLYVAQEDFTAFKSARKATVSHAEDSKRLLDVVIEMTVQINNVAYANTRMLGEIKAVSSRSDKVYALSEGVLKSIEQVASNAVDADTQSQEASGAARQGETVVGRAMAAIQEIEQVVNEVETRVESLQQENEKISSTSQAIDAIAKKTNLLALNATIEAARAGEAGRGFAVVAGEVKDLSKQTAEATQGISSRIDSLRREMDSITSKMEETTGAVNEGQTTMEEVTVQMQSIANVSNDTSTRMSQISSLLEEQRVAVEGVTGDTKLIAHSTTANSEALQKNLEAMQAVSASLGQQLGLLAGQDIPHKDIKIARADHAMWKKRFADMIIGNSNMTKEELSDSRQTRFGRWFEDAKMKYADHPVIWTIDVPLNQVHQEAVRTFELHQAERFEEAFANLQTVDSYSADVQQCMVLLLQAVEAEDAGEDAGEAAALSADQDDIELF